MATRRREKELARAKHDRQAGRREAQARRRHRINIGLGIALGAVIVAALVGIVITVVRSNQESSAADAAADAAAASQSAALASALASLSASPSASPSASASASATSSPSASTTPAIACQSAGPAAVPTLSFSAAPAAPAKLPTTLTLGTNCGDIVIALDPKAPTTVGSEAFLAQQGFYNGTRCHRLTTDGIFVLQCGDPKGDGTGGPGYTIPDENLPTSSGVNYPAGTVAMANAGANTGGSQFFIVYRDTTLPPGYSIWGHVTSGLDVVQGIAAAGTANGTSDGPPQAPVAINTATISG